MDSSFCRYLRKIFADWFVNWSFMTDKRKRFVFRIQESQTNKAPTNTTKYPGLLWQRAYWRAKFPGGHLLNNRFSKNDLGNLLMLCWVLILSSSSYPYHLILSIQTRVENFHLYLLLLAETAFQWCSYENLF